MSHPAAPPGGAGAGVLWTAVSLSLCTCGAGLLSLPFAAATAGLPTVLFVLVVSALLSGAMNLILAEFAYAHRHVLRGARTFDALAARVLGPRHFALVSAQVLVGLAGALVGFMCVASDLGLPVLRELCTGAEGGAATACAALATRGGTISLFSVLVALPLAGCARVHALRAASALGVAAVVAVSALLAVRGGVALGGGGGGGGGLPTAPRSASAVLAALPIVLYALGNHVQSVPIFLECSPPAMRRFHVSVVLTYVGICALYAAAALGAAAFGADTRGDVLDNFALGDAPADAAKLLMAVHVAIVIAVDALVTRKSLSLALRRCRRSGGSGDGSGSGGGGAGGAPAGAQGIDPQPLLPPAAAEALDPQPLWASPPLLARSGSVAAASGSGGALGKDGSRGGEEAGADAAAAASLSDAADEAAEEALPRICGTPCSAAIAAQTASCVLGAAVVALAFPSVNVVFGLLGATLSVTCVFTYPALFLLARAAELERGAGGGGRGDGGGGGSGGGGGDGDGGGGGSDGRGGGSDSQGEYGGSRWLGYISTSPTVLRAQGWALLLLSAVLIVGGTGVNVWELVRSG